MFHQTQLMEEDEALNQVSLLLAAVNRFKAIEPHYGSLFLSFLLKAANIYIKIFTNHDFYYENLNHLEFKKLFQNLKLLIRQSY